MRMNLFTEQAKMLRSKLFTKAISIINKDTQMKINELQL